VFGGVPVIVVLICGLAAGFRRVALPRKSSGWAPTGFWRLLRAV